MKKICLLALLLLSLKNLNAQVVFCPPGAQWNYIYKDYWMPGVVNNNQVTYARDSILGSDTLKALTHTYFHSECAYSSCSPTLIKQKGDTIFMRNACTNGTWQILYNFSALPGHVWYNTISIDHFGMSSANYTITVMSASTIVVNGYNLKELTVQYTFKRGNYQIIEQPVKITERLGCSNNLFNFRNKWSTDCNFIAGFLCYKDSAFGTTQLTTLPCEYNNPVGVKENNLDKHEFLVFPNPSSDFIEIHSDFIQESKTIEFTDLSGRRTKHVDRKSAGNN